MELLYGIRAFPLRPSKITLVIGGVPTAVANAIRRELADELPGRALVVPPGGFDSVATTDPFMLPRYVEQRIHHLGVRPDIPRAVADAAVYDLDVLNTTEGIMAFHASDLVLTSKAVASFGPLFNPTAQLGYLQPGKRIVIRNIRVADGRGRDDSAFSVACQCAIAHVDLARGTRADVNLKGGRFVDYSGYVDARGANLPPTLADPRVHRLTATLKTTPPNQGVARAVLADACAHLGVRTQAAARVIAQAADGAEIPTSGGSLAQGLATGAGSKSAFREATVDFPGETSTIGELLRRLAFELDPSVLSVTSSRAADDDVQRVSVRVAHGDAYELLARAADLATEIFTAFRAEFA